MLQDKKNRVSPINTKAIIVGMILMFIIVHIGFYFTYIQHFPEFEGFSFLHHIHGALMGFWVLLLVVQPILIHNRKFAAHRFIGKLTYLMAPIIVVLMILIARYNYHSGILEKSSEEIFAKQSNTWMQIFMFTLFYSLAIFFRKNTDKHMRFMIATAIVMIGPALSRTILHFWGQTSVPYFAIVPLYFKTALVATLLTIDVIKKKNWMPYTIVLSAFILADIVYHARYSDAWQTFGKFIINNLY